MKRARAGSERPSEARNSGCSAGIELGDLRLDRGAEGEDLGAPARARARSTAAGASAAAVLLGDVHDDEQRPAGEEGEVRQLLLLGLAPASCVRSGCPGRGARGAAPARGTRRSPCRCSLRSRSSRFSTIARSCSTSSASKSRELAVRVGRRAVAPRGTRGRRGRTSPPRRGRAATSASRPDALAAGPGTSTKRISAKVVFFGLKIADSASMRGSGTLMAPRFTWPRPAAALVQAGERVEERRLARLRVADEPGLHGET